MNPPDSKAYGHHLELTDIVGEDGAAQLGAQTFCMSPDQMQTSRGEPIRDTARIIDRYCDGLFIRTFGQEVVEETSPV